MSDASHNDNIPPVSELFTLIGEWMLAQGHIPQGADRAVITCAGPADGMEIALNQLAESRLVADTWTIPPYSIVVHERGMPVYIGDPFGGAVMFTTEDRLIGLFGGAA